MGRSDFPTLRLHAGAFAGPQACRPASSSVRTWIIVVVMLAIVWRYLPNILGVARAVGVPDRYSQKILELGAVTEKERRACHSQDTDDLDVLIEGNPQDGEVRPA